MSVTLYEPAIKALLENEAGPVGQMLRRTLNVVAGNEQAIIGNIFAQNPVIAPNVVDEIVHTDDGMVGIVNLQGGSVADYFAAKMEREEWIVPAIFQNWDSQI